MKKLTTLVLSVCIASTLFAQKRFDIFSVSGNYNFLETSNTGNNQNYEAGIMANLNIPIVLKDSSIWYSSIDYQYFSIPTESTVYNNLESLKLNGFILRTGLVYKLNTHKYIHILFAPRYMGDMNASFKKSVQLGGVLMYENQKNDDFTYRIGVLYNEEFFGTYIVPVVYLDWALTQKIKFTGLLPVYGKLYYQSSPNFSAGLHFIGLTTTYRMNDSNLGILNNYIDRRSIDLSLFSNIHIWDNLFFEGRFGYSLSKDYGLYAESDKITLGLPLVNIGDDRTRLNEEFDPSLFVHFKLIYSIPIN